MVKSGSQLIQEERARQVEAEGWSPAHDDQHEGAELVSAGMAYAEVARKQVLGGSTAYWRMLSDYWPFSSHWWKPADYPVRNLVKAGALIAAEIDRLQRKAGAA